MNKDSDFVLVFRLQDFICPPPEIFSVYLGHARAHDKFSGG